jgi:hypothetical protein
VRRFLPFAVALAVAAIACAVGSLIAVRAAAADIDPGRGSAHDITIEDNTLRGEVLLQYHLHRVMIDGKGGGPMSLAGLRNEALFDTAV